WPGVLSLETNVIFRAFALTNAADERVVRGYLLLGEANLAQGYCGAAEAALQPLKSVPLNQRLDWERLYLQCRIQIADGRAAEALQNTTNLLALAAATSDRERQAESAAFQAAILERLGRLEEAM